MAAPDREWLTTGGVARLCSVKPDTVQKWIRNGWLPAQRTAGGHYRIAVHDVSPFLTAHTEPKWFPPPPAGCRPRPLRCWEYLSQNGVISEACTKCAVYRIRAAWCFEVLGISGNGHSRQFCQNQESCQDCLYFQRVCGAPLTILVVTADRELVSQLSGQNGKNLVVLFASSGYEASALIGSARPAFVILDEDLCEDAEPGLLQHLIHDARVPGLRIALCGSRDAAAPQDRAVFARFRKPFDRAAIAALLDQLPVEPRPTCAG